MRRRDASGHRRADGTGLVALSRRQTVATAAAGSAVGISLFVLALGADDLRSRTWCDVTSTTSRSRT